MDKLISCEMGWPMEISSWGQISRIKNPTELETAYVL